MKPQIEPLTGLDSFRLLKIRRGSGDDPIICSTSNFELKQAPPYSTLSYTWDAARDEELEVRLREGNKPIEIEINLNAGVIRIFQNLYHALFQLREDGCWDYLWIDAICINQSDNVEKASQIMLMGEIYSTAQEVIVWLGPESASSDGFRWVNEEFGRKLIQYDNLKPVMTLNWNETLADEAFNGYSYEDNKLRWDQYRIFYSEHRWFSRAWIIQEVALARKISVRIGSKDLSWYMMEFVGKWVSSSRLADTLRGATEMKTLGAEVNLLGHTRESCQFGNSDFSSSGMIALRAILARTYGSMSDFQACLTFMMDTIIKFRQARATDPRDKIFCAFGLFQRFHKLSIKMSQDVSVLEFFQNSDDIKPIFPSYNLTTAQVFVNFTAFLIQKLPNLTILSDVEDETRRKLIDIPSWVPDYNSLVGSRSLTWGFTHCDYDVSLTDPLHGSPSLRSISGNILTLRGLKIDTVDILCPAMASCRIGGTEKWLNNVCILLSSYLNVLNSLKVTYKGSQSRLEALWRTTIADQFEDARAAPEAGVYFHVWVCMNATYTAKMTPDPRSVPGYVDLIRELKIFETSATRRKPIAVFTTAAGQEVRVEPRTDYAISGYTLPSVDSVVECIELLSRERTTDEEQTLKLLEKGFDRFEQALLYVHMDRRLYKTLDGLLGLGPLSTQPGDEVWLLCDGKIPMVLRPTSVQHQYKLVGDSYFHGFMHGEVSETSGLANSIREVNII